MMAEPHPQDAELLAYVDEELAGARAGEVAAHMRSCETCATQVRDLKAARDALRASPLLHLPAERRSLLLAGLPGPARAGRARPRRLLALVAALVTVAALLAVFAAQENGPTVGGEAERGAERAPEEGGGRAPSQTGETARRGDERARPGDGRALPEAALSGAPPVARVAGPPAQVADFLREQGYDARVVGRAVEVRTERRAALRRLLTRRFVRGGVSVYVR